MIPWPSPEVVWGALGALVGFFVAAVRASRKIDRLIDIIYWLSRPR